jgi:hypothetical protein
MGKFSKKCCGCGSEVFKVFEYTLQLKPDILICAKCGVEYE